MIPVTIAFVVCFLAIICFVIYSKERKRIEKSAERELHLQAFYELPDEERKKCCITDVG